MWHWLAVFFGLQDGSGTGYLFWSGIGSDIGELAIVGAIWHHLNCRESGCWWIARHAHDGYCRKHRKG